MEGDRSVVVLEDAHWFDTLSWRLLAALRTLRPNAAILILSRPEGQDDMPGQVTDLFTRAAPDAVQLGVLSRADTGRLLSATLNVDDVPPPVLDRVFALTEGHPLFARELVLLMR